MICIFQIIRFNRMKYYLAKKDWATTTPKVSICLKQPNILNREVFVQFFKEEIERLDDLSYFKMVLNFMGSRPSLDVIQSYIKYRWAYCIYQLLGNQMILSKC